MTKFGALFWVGLVLASGFTTFKIKHAVQDIDDELIRVRRHVVAEQQEIRVLTAEWTYLNQPERLAELNRAFLQLGPISPRQLQQRLADLHWRAPVAGSEPAATEPPPVAVVRVAAPASPPPQPRVAAAAPPPAAPLPAAVPTWPAALPAVQSAAAPPPISVRLVKIAPEALDALIEQIADTR